MAENTYNQVQCCYGDIAKRTSATSTQHNSADTIATAFGYSAKDLGSLPDNTNLGLSCGNPVAYANMQEGETVVDLGSGGGIDVFLAARKVGPQGKAIGVDMTKHMIELANRNAKSAGLSNVQFIEALITSIPLPDSSINCIISNCVINLVPSKDKPSVFYEIARLLKPGGRVAISDILARKELPQNIVDDMALYVGCIAGASQVADYEDYLRQAGFQGTYLFYVLIVDAETDLNVYKQSSNLSGCCSTDESKKSTVDYAAIDYNEWAGGFTAS
ncbi:hypothetical protein ASPWEDRAFT_119259 [Aspergillus wentii DTO 134E9]|uniref:Arsenite methyltransferase n=1 Tax=Aspergillus wentii DTO 134E9 TaxID=1073089 RepID=A0A1L9R7X2_ASPWE|nr:uncharacterized protein ASPWEDRAFT_119259 [Aspergillus wentii DTO 134E9]OJJ30973.1 hypothetical protein ASPWEDRAFT_119259 [Aspergillus wentii DTO 134E9]